MKRKMQSAQEEAAAAAAEESVGDNYSSTSLAADLFEGINKECAKFRSNHSRHSAQNLPNFDTLHNISDDLIGKYSQSSMGTSVSVESDQECSQSSVGTPDSEESDESSQSSMGTSDSVESYDEMDQLMVRVLNSWAKNMAAETESLRLSNYYHSPPPNSTIEACMDVLQSMSGVNGYAFVQACERFMDINHRMIFASLRDEQSRLAWVYNRNISPRPPHVHQPVYTPIPYHVPPPVYALSPSYVPPPTYAAPYANPYTSPYAKPYASPYPLYYTPPRISNWPSAT